MNDMKSESSISYKLSPMEFSTRLSKYDVISFDLLDTLIFRPFCCPLEMCLGNPYMQIVVELLSKKGKRMIITSDLDSKAEQISSLLESCGYPKFGALYISSEKGATKSRGDLYDLVRSCEGFVEQWHRQAEKCEELKHISMKDACAPLRNMFRQR